MLTRLELPSFARSDEVTIVMQILLRGETRRDEGEVGNKPAPMERKNNDPHGREIIGARSLRVPQRQGQRERCPARSKDLHLHPAPGVRPDVLGVDGREGGRRLLFIVPSAERSRKRRRRTKSIR